MSNLLIWMRTQDVNERLVNLNAAVKYLSEDKSRTLEAKVSHRLLNSY